MISSHRRENLTDEASIMLKLPAIENLNARFEGGQTPVTRSSFATVDKIGNGAFGKVFKVVSIKTNEKYALKVLGKSHLMSLRLGDQLNKELDIMIRCEHENITKVFAAFEDDISVYLVLELANGSLFHKLCRAKRFSEVEAATMTTDILRALVYLHTRDPPIIHRDIKSENILEFPGRYKLADFGWSNFGDAMRQTICGTPDYLAPEMIRGSGHSIKIDIWCMGVLLYELTQGKTPFRPRDRVEPSQHTQAITKNILSGNFKFDIPLSPPAEKAIRLMMSFNEKERPSASECLQLEFFKKIRNPVSQIDLSSPRVRTEAVSPRDRPPVQPDSARRYVCSSEKKIEFSSSFAETQKYRQALEKETLIRQKLTVDLAAAKASHEAEKASYEAKIKALESELKNLHSANLELTNKLCQNQKEPQKEGSGISERVSEDSAKELENLRLKTEKLQETTKYLYIKAKETSKLVSDFFVRHCGTQPNMKQTMEFVLSYDNTQQKLKFLFDRFVEYKQRATSNAPTSQPSSGPIHHVRSYSQQKIPVRENNLLPSKHEG